MASILDWLRRLLLGRRPKAAKVTREKRRRRIKRIRRIRKIKAKAKPRKKKLVKIKIRKISRRQRKIKIRGKKVKSKGKPLISFSLIRKPRPPPKILPKTKLPPKTQPKPQAPSRPSFSFPKISFPKLSTPKLPAPKIPAAKFPTVSQQKLKELAKVSAPTPVPVPAHAPVIAKPAKFPPIHKLPEEITREVIVSDIMVKNVHKVKIDDTLSFVVRLFADKGISGAPVMHDNTFVGVISETDILKIIGAKDLLSIGGLGLKRLGEIKVEHVMNRNIVTVNEYTTLAHAADLMNKYDVMRLPVLDERRNVVGIITRTDIIRGISKEILFRILKRKPEELEKLRMRIETDIDEILRIVDRKGLIGVDEIQKKLNIPQEKIEEWGKVLEKHDLVEVFYPPIGKPELRKKQK